MTIAIDKEYADAVFEIASQPVLTFAPFIFVNNAGDCVEFFVSPKSYYAQRVDDCLTLYMDEVTEEIVGFVVKNLTRILAKMETHQAAYSFVVRDGEIQLEALFAAMLFEDGQRITYVREYRKVADLARSNSIDKVRIPTILEKSRAESVHERMSV